MPGVCGVGEWPAASAAVKGGSDVGVLPVGAALMGWGHPATDGGFAIPAKNDAGCSEAKE